MPDKKLCPHCGASMMEYKHSINVGLIAGLVRLHRHGKPVNLKHLNLTRNQWDNFQKLRYWDLVTPTADPDGSKKGGTWRLTMKGASFVMGKIAVPRSVWTYRGRKLRYEGSFVKIHDIDEGYKYRPDYAAEAQQKGERE